MFADVTVSIAPFCKLYLRQTVNRIAVNTEEIEEGAATEGLMSPPSPTPGSITLKGVIINGQADVVALRQHVVWNLVQ